MKEQNEVTLSEKEDQDMELNLTIVPGRQLERPGKKALYLLPQILNPKPPLVKTVNIVIKHLDPIKYPILSNYTNMMIQNLQKDNFLHVLIGLSIRAEVREFILDKVSNQLKINGPTITNYHIVPKGSYMYTLYLPNNHFLILRHLKGRWYRALAYFSNHDTYSNFLNVFFTNKTFTTP